MRWSGVIAIVAVALVFGGTLYAYKRLTDDETTRSTVNEAVLRFRRVAAKAEPKAMHPRGEVPVLGVYRYRTRGDEHLSTVAASTGHDYGGGSTVTLLPTSCGLIERWQVLIQRWSEGKLCTKAHTSRVVSVTDFHEFFGKAKTTAYHCAGGTTPYTSGLRPGMRWTSNCRSADGTISNRSWVVGIENVKVGSRSYSAAHVTTRAVLTGDPDGTGRRDSWLRRSDGLLLRRTAASDVHVDVSGGGHFTERYALHLLSAQPQR